MQPTSFTGFARRRTSSRAVRAGDRVARACITVGGFGTIAAILLVCGFLVAVVLPLFLGSDLDARTSVSTATRRAPLLHQQIDEYRQVVWQLAADGVVRLHDLAAGGQIAAAEAFAPGKETALAVRGERALVALQDGTVAVVRIRVPTPLLRPDEAPAGLQAVRVGGGVGHAGAYYQRTPDGWRRFTLEVGRGEPLALGGAAIAVADFAVEGESVTLATVDTEGAVAVRSVERVENEFTGEVKTRTVGGSLQLADLAAGAADAAPPDRVLMLGDGEAVLLVWNDGRALRLDARDPERPALVERFDLLAGLRAGAPAGPPPRIVHCALLTGHQTLLVADDTGRVRSWFRTRPPEGEPRGSDGVEMSAAHSFASDSPVLDIATSTRSRLFATGHRDGSIRVWHATSERLVGEARLPAVERLEGIALAPREDGLVAASGRALHRFDLDPGHPEVTLSAIAAPVWYEGHPAPEHAWQSTGGTDDFEPKLGLWPLVFGTIKATLYCLLFGVPLALLAAIYTSEFLHPRRRARIKPLVESMASLPSVVLGFLAALVFAPWVEAWLTTLLAAVLTVPLVWLLGAQLVQMLPPRRRVVAERWRLWLVLGALPVGLWLAALAGDGLERLLFGGDLASWLAAVSVEGEDTASPAFGGFFLALLPVSAVGAALLVGRSDWLANLGASAGVARTLLGTALAVAAAAALAGLIVAGGELLASLGWWQGRADLRPGLVDTYVQRNALVVGFVMGFAVIPIVYTIADDALTAVPEHLRAASLGAGATPWQTATRIVLPTAMSGIFSAVMVGLGRAVGETMIVLMATGSTPILEMNPFNGFRTLSANIAIELPEAVRDSTHYRMLYLAALVLFAMTFALNTVAEVVRQRFRRRAWQL